MVGNQEIVYLNSMLLIPLRAQRMLYSIAEGHLDSRQESKLCFSQSSLRFLQSEDLIISNKLKRK